MVVTSLVAVAIGAACAAPARATTGWGDPAYMAIETDRIIDAMDVPTMDMNLTRWTREILPWFSAQGIVRAERPLALVRYTTFSGPQGNLVLGEADCAGARVFMTNRYVNPVSSRYGSVDMLFTLTHELAHVQQNALCTRAPGGIVESSAQLMALEVLAAMALDGNRWAGLAVLRELRSIALGTLELRAERGLPGADDTLATVSGTILTNAEQARVAEHLRSWERTPLLHAECLLDYAARPYRKLAAALDDDLVVTGLASPITHSRPWASRPTDGTLVVDSLAAFLDSASGLYE
jgi:hypothetical protein